MPVLKKLPWINATVLCKVCKSLKKCLCCSCALAHLSPPSKLLIKWIPLRLSESEDQGAYGITDGWRGEMANAAFSLRWSENLKYSWERKKKSKSFIFYQWHIWCSCVWALNQNRDVDTDLSFHGQFPSFLYKSELFCNSFYVNCFGLLQMVFDIIELPVCFIPTHVQYMPTFPKQK